MSFRQTAIAFIVAAAAAPAAFAETGTWYPGEIGFVPDAPQSTLTREQVKKELADFLKRGGRLAAGEMNDYFDPAAPVVRMAAPQINTQQMGSSRAPFDPYADFSPNSN